MPRIPSTHGCLRRGIARVLETFEVIEDLAFVLMCAELASLHRFASKWDNLWRPIVRWIPVDVSSEVDSPGEFLGALFADDLGFYQKGQ
jgi:hypothetical protein